MSKPTTLLLDFDSWKRAFNPALRVVGYTSAIFLVITIVTTLPLYLMGAPEGVYIFFTYVNTILFFFGVILSFFKVLDEERDRPVTQIAEDSIKLM